MTRTGYFSALGVVGHNRRSVAHAAVQTGPDGGVSRHVRLVAVLREVTTRLGTISHNDPVATGKRAGSRRGTKQKASFNGPALTFALAITGCLIAWGYLVYLAIDFGTSARAGESGAWVFLVLASLGAVACLFAGLLFVSRLLRALGITSDPSVDEAPPAPVAARAPGGRRAAR